MKCNKGHRFLSPLFVLVMLLTVSFVAAPSFGATDADKKKQEERERIQKRIDELEKQKREEAEKAKREQDKQRPTGQNLQDVILQYEKLLAGCAEKKSTRCPEVLAALASLYYDEARDSYVAKRNEYEKKMSEWEKTQKGPEPVNPLPDYSKSLLMYNRLATEYPDFAKIDEAYYQIGNIYTVMGEIEKSRDAFLNLVKKMPNSPRASSALVRLADYAYMMEHDNVSALKYLDQVNTSQITIEMQEMVMYRKGEIAYNMGDFDKATNQFFNYTENCDNGTYRKCEYKDQSLEMMAVAFSDMGNGSEEATKFFRAKGGRPYEPYVIYTIGMKNRVHGQYDDAINSLQGALKRFPYYKDAPVAQQMLVECFLVKKLYEKANEAREKLVDMYGPGSEWYTKNSNERAVIERSQGEVRRALASIPVYFHTLADKSKDRAMYERALKRYNEFFTRFPEDKWRIYEFKNYVAEIYSALGDYLKAAEAYDFVAMEDLSKYPEYKVDFDTVGYEQEELEKAKKEAQNTVKSISQEDAGYNAIVCYDNARKKALAKSNVSEEQSLSLPETQQFLAYIDKFQKRFPKSNNAADVVYLAGNVYFAAKDYQNAVRQYQTILTNQPNSKVSDKALRMLANSYANTGEFDLAQAKYRELLAKTQGGTQEYAEVADLAAGAMYKKAEAIKKAGNVAGAVEAFKAIASVFPDSKVADRGWFEAGVCYEAVTNYAEAAALFESLPDKFPKSTAREDAFFRSAENYKKLNKVEQAANVLLKGANSVTKPQFAITALSTAADYYQKASRYDMAGKMYQMIYERYASDPKTPQALYAAGMSYEKGKFYEDAIKVYLVLAEKFAQSEYASEAFFSVGLCYEKMGQNEAMAAAFTDYAKRYPNDRYKQVQALVKAGEAYYNQKNFEDATKNFTMAMDIAKEFGKTKDIDPADVAHACYMLGEVKYQDFLAVKLDAASEKEVAGKLKEKTKALEEAAKAYQKALEIGVEEWTMKATYRIAQGFVDLADAWASQKLFGSKDQQAAMKITIARGLEQYYTKALTYFQKNIEWAYGQNIQGEFVDKSIDKIMEMAYRIGHNYEDIGAIFKNSPIPRGLSPEEEQAYKDLLEEKYLEAQDASVPKYELGVKLAADLGIPNNQWLDKIRERIAEIKPASEVLKIQIAAHKFEEAPPEAPATAQPAAGTGKQKQEAAPKQGPASTSGAAAPVAGRRDSDYERSKTRIRNIMSMSIDNEEKIHQLNRIEMEASRKVMQEEDRIRELKDQLQATQ
jgi:cellulose synthase operon protein C